MRYFIDTEFNEFGGDLISLAIVREDGESIYIVYPELPKYGEWVAENVIPIIWSIPSPLPGMAYKVDSIEEGARLIASFMGEDKHPVIITDWPDDIKYFCQAIMTGPGMMVGLNNLVFQMIRVSAYPTTLENAVQHNAWHDAMALRELFR